MSDTAAGLLTVLALVVVLGVTHVPLGDYMARVYSATTHWRAERVLYRVCRIDPDADQTWATYAAVGAGLLAGVGAVPLRPPARAARAAAGRWATPGWSRIWRGTPRRRS